MDAVYEKDTLAKEANFATELLGEEYLGDFFDDDLSILEDMDAFDFLVEEDAVNDNFWDVMDIGDTEDVAAWLSY